MQVTRIVPTMMAFVDIGDAKYLRGEAGEMWIELKFDGSRNRAQEVPLVFAAGLEQAYRKALDLI